MENSVAGLQQGRRVWDMGIASRGLNQCTVFNLLDFLKKRQSFSVGSLPTCSQQPGLDKAENQELHPDLSRVPSS